MKISMEYDVNDCRDCPFMHEHSGHGECWVECSHKDATEKAGGTWKTILWGCQEEFTRIPEWCPLKLGRKNEG